MKIAILTIATAIGLAVSWTDTFQAQPRESVQIREAETIEVLRLAWSDEPVTMLRTETADRVDWRILETGTAAQTRQLASGDACQMQIDA